MAKLTKADVARHLGISRQTLYEWISKGRISVGSDGLIDSAEVARVSGSVTKPDTSALRHHGQVVTSPEGDTTRELIDVLKAQLAEAQARERFLQEQVDRLTSIIDRRLLEAPRAAPPTPQVPLRRVSAGNPHAMRRHILEVLQEHPEGLHHAAIAQALGVESSLGPTLRGMLRDRMVRRVGAGIYQRSDSKR